MLDLNKFQIIGDSALDKMKTEKNIKKGKKNRASGAEFERRVRKDLEEKGWIVDKWGNNVEFMDTKNIDIPGELDIVKDYGKLIQAKNKWAGPGRPMMMGAGFCDFIAFRKVELSTGHEARYYEVIGVEVKTNGYLTKEEKEKCKWLLNNGIFNKILIARKTKVKNKIVIEYHDFKEKYGKEL